MTDKEQRIICKYKLLNVKKFDGQPYCSCFSESCKNLPICDDNCQIFEDYQQLTRKTQECERMKYYLDKIRDKELSNLDIEWDEYITGYDTTDYSNIITYVEYALGVKEDDILDIISKVKGE